MVQICQSLVYIVKIEFHHGAQQSHPSPTPVLRALLLSFFLNASIWLSELESSTTSSIPSPLSNAYLSFAVFQTLIFMGITASANPVSLTAHNDQSIGD